MSAHASGLELLLRVLGVAELIVVAIVMFRARRPDPSGRIGAALCVSIAAFLVTSAHGAAEAFGALVYPLSAICSTHPVWFWVFCAALFADRPRISRIQTICIASMAAAGLAYWLTLTGQPWFRDPFGIALGLASLVFICLGPVSVFAGRAADLDERRRGIRTIFVPVVSGYLAAVVITQLVVLLAGRPTPHALVLINLGVIDSLAMLALLTFVQLRIVNWLDLTGPVANTQGLSRLEQGVLDRLNQRLAAERLYAREGLSIAALAELLGTQEHVLRRVINGGMGYRNFNDFLHAHRLREASRRLRDPSERRVPVLTIALEAGYSSIGPFNRAFRERFGVTPTVYRQTASPVLTGGAFQTR